MANSYTHLWNRYRLREEDYIQMLVAQKDKCYICSESFGNTKGTKGQVDHCHRQKKIRKLLCSKCNRRVGRAERGSQITEGYDLSLYLGYIEEHASA